MMTPEKRFLKFLLGFINFMFLLFGLAMIAYGIHMVLAYHSSFVASFISSGTDRVEYQVSSSLSTDDTLIMRKSSLELLYSHPSRASASDKREVASLQRNDGRDQVQLRKLISQKFQYLEFPSISSFWDILPAAWFLDAILFLGAIITLVACSGYIAATTVHINCLHCYSFVILLVMVVELAVARLLFFDESWEKVIPSDSTGQLNILEEFIEDRLTTFKWIGLGVLILQVLALFFSVILVAISSTASRWCDSDDESISPSIIHPPFSNWQANKVTNSTEAAYGSK